MNFDKISSKKLLQVIPYFIFFSNQYDENSTSSPSVSGASPRSTDPSGQVHRSSGVSDNHEPSGAVTNGTRQNKPSNIQVKKQSKL